MFRRSRLVFLGKNQSYDCWSHQQICLAFITLILAVFGALPSLAGGNCAPAPAGVIGWWAGDGNANTLIGTNNGALQGTATATSPGINASCFTFDGTNSFIAISNSVLLQPTNLTIEAWIRFSGLDSSGSSAPGDQYIVFKQNSRSGDFEGFDLGKGRTGGVDYFRFIVTSSSGVSAEIHSATLISTGVWYHVAAVRGSNFTQIYINGQLERQTNVSFAQDYGNLPVYFGTTGQNFWDHRFKGNLDEVTIYNRALSSNEIAAIYSAGNTGKCKQPDFSLQPQAAAPPSPPPQLA
jgi:Concanavalin A-like lectin/glucanases superfamily